MPREVYAFLFVAFPGYLHLNVCVLYSIFAQTIHLCSILTKTEGSGQDLTKQAEIGCNMHMTPNFNGSNIFGNIAFYF